MDGDTGPSIGRCSMGNGFKVIAVGHSIVVLVGCSLHLQRTTHFLAAVTVDGKLVCRRQVQSRHHVAHPPFAPRRLRAGNHRPLATGNPPFHRHLFAAPFAVPLQRDTVVGPSRNCEVGQQAASNRYVVQIDISRTVRRRVTSQRDVAARAGIARQVDAVVSPCTVRRDGVHWRETAHLAWIVHHSHHHAVAVIVRPHPEVHLQRADGGMVSRHRQHHRGMAAAIGPENQIAGVVVRDQRIVVVYLDFPQVRRPAAFEILAVLQRQSVPGQGVAADGFRRPVATAAVRHQRQGVVGARRQPRNVVGRRDVAVDRQRSSAAHGEVHQGTPYYTPGQGDVVVA